MKIHALLGLGLLLCSPAVFADTITLNPSDDATISSYSGVRDAGGDAVTMIAGTLGFSGGGVPARALLRFNLSDIPQGSVVTSAALTVTVTRSGTATPQLYSLHRLLTDWTESAATWDDSGVSAWSGGNFAPPPDATATLGSSGGSTFGSSTGLINTVQRWLTNSASNFGWMLRNQNEATPQNARRLAARESGTDMPALVIDFTPPPPPPPASVTLVNVRVEAGKIRFNFAALAGTSYTVEGRDALEGASHWMPIITHPDPMESSLIPFCETITGTRRFYRVVSP